MRSSSDSIAYSFVPSLRSSPNTALSPCPSPNPGGGEPRGPLRTLSRAQARVEGVAQAVAEEVGGDDDDHDRQAGEGGDPGRVEQVLAAVGDHEAPLGGGRLGAQAEEAERGGGQDDQAEVER